MENVSDEGAENSHSQIASMQSANQQPGGIPMGDMNNAAMFTMTEGELEDPLDRCPPDFEWAKKHREANRVKNLDARNTASKDLSDEDLYCP